MSVDTKNKNTNARKPAPTVIIWREGDRGGQVSDETHATARGIEVENSGRASTVEKARIYLRTLERGF